MLHLHFARNMEVRHILGSYLILVLFDLTLSDDPKKKFRSQYCLVRAKGFYEATEKQTTEPSINATAPKEKLKITFRIPLPKDFQTNLNKFRCNCHKIRTSNPLKFRRVVNTCPSVTRSVTIGFAVDGCWVHSDFRYHECPYTTCDHFGKCTGVTTNYGIARCVQDQFKEVIYYAWCWKGGWFLQEKRLFLPTCCSCRWFCR